VALDLCVINFAKLCHRSCIEILAPSSRVEVFPCRQHTLPECRIVMTYTMYKLRTRVCLCSQLCSPHAMPRHPVPVRTGTLGTLFEQQHLHVILRFLVFCGLQVTPLYSIGVFCYTQASPLVACYSPQALRSLVTSYMLTAESNAVSNPFAVLNTH
jgi:hypothetical protein